MRRFALLALVAVLGVILEASQLPGATLQDPQLQQELFRDIDQNRDSHLSFL